MDAFLARVAGHFSTVVAEGWLATVTVVSFLSFSAIITVLQDQTSYREIVSSANEPRALYLRMMWWAQARFDRFFGFSLSYRALDRCIALALIYPLLLLILAWTRGAEPELVGLTLFSAGASEWLRVALLLLALVLILVLSVVVAKHERIAHLLLAVVLPRLKDHGIVLGCVEFLVLCAAVSGAFVVAGFGAIAGAVAVAFAGAVAIAVAFAFAVADVVAGAVAVAFAGAFASAVAVAVSGTVASAVAGEFTSTFASAGAGAVAFVAFALLVLLPLSNALFDWLSWAVSRGLLWHLVGPTPGQDVRYGSVPHLGFGKLLSHCGLDALVALVLLLAVALALPVVLQLFNALSASYGMPPLEWWRYLAEARAEPFGRGIFVTAMLLTTLLPTMAHLLAVAMCLLLPAPSLYRSGGRATRFMAALMHPRPSLLTRSLVCLWILFVALASWLLLLISGIVFEAALWAWHAPIGTCLADAAQHMGLSVGPALPANATGYIAPIKCPLLLD